MKSIGVGLLTIGCLLLGLAHPVAAQRRVCGADELHTQMLQNPAYQRIMDMNEAAYQEYVSRPHGGNTEGGVRTIPVVFHIIQSSDIPLVADSDCLSQLDVLNEDYRKMAGTPGDGNGVDCMIQFCLATIDPNGCPTTGINRIVAPQWAYHEQTDAAIMKGLSQWDPYSYLNVWVPRTIETTSGAGQVIGYATFPYNLPVAPNLDGVVIHSNFLGRDGDPLYQGRTGTHEVGHWLGEFHTFQNGCQGATASTCASQGDRVCDTPQAAEANFGCPVLNSCTDTPVDNPDQIENYMDYSDGVCQNMWTAGQKDRMDFYLGSVRQQLVSPANLTATGCDGTVSAGCAPTPNFKADHLVVCAGVPVQFTDLSQLTPTGWSWSFTGGNPATSTTQNPVVTFNAAGSYDVSLVANNGSGSATETKFAYIEVVAPTMTPLVQGFEGILSLPTYWYIEDNQGLESWELTGAAHSEGSKSMKIKNFEARNSGESMSLHSNPFSMANVVSGYMTFDHSYKKFSGLTSDELEVEISTDCGSTWTALWSKAGPYLATVAGSAAGSEWVPTQATQWKSDTISLDSFAGQPSVKIRWTCHSGGGQTIYIDNINMNTVLVAAPDAAGMDWGFQVSPNPFRDDLRVAYSLARPESISFEMTDVSGKVIFRHETGMQGIGNHELGVAASAFRGLAPGVYFLKGTGKSGMVTRKLVKMD
jgi:PKD repeat protein